MIKLSINIVTNITGLVWYIVDNGLLLLLLLLLLLGSFFINNCVKFHLNPEEMADTDTKTNPVVSKLDSPSIVRQIPNTITEIIITKFNRSFSSPNKNEKIKTHTGVLDFIIV